jgi:YbbR domain-containing protein
VKQLAAATTEPIDVSGRSQRVRDQVTVGLADPAIRLVHTQVANVSVDIVPAPIERQVDRVPVRWRNLPGGLRAQVAPALVRVTVRGSRSAVEKLRPDAISAFVDLAGLGSGRYNLRVQVDPSQTFGVSALTPAVVDVVIK